MTEENKPDEPVKTTEARTRPFVLTLLCLFSFIYFGIFLLLFLAGLVKARSITRIMDQYLSTELPALPPAAWIFGVGFTLHALAFAGVILVWKLRKTGYYFLGLACLIIAALQLINPMAAVASTAIYIVFLLLFGLFFRRLH